MVSVIKESPSVNDTALSVPFAVEAGLGKLSRLNKMVSPEFGAGVRLCKVFTDLPMACDKPIDCGIVEFCKRCKKCAEACPSRALSFDEEPSFKVRGPLEQPRPQSLVRRFLQVFPVLATRR